MSKSERPAYGKTLATTMTLVREGQKDINSMADDLERALYNPEGSPHWRRCALTGLINRQRERLSFLASEVGRFELL